MEEGRIHIIVPIIERASRLSLRLLDYFCVNYAREKRVGYLVNDQYFDVHASYKDQLKTYSKKLFDPFKRHARIYLKTEAITLETTVGQLCFFHWCINNKVLEYVTEHMDEISEHMKRTLQRPDNVPSEPSKRPNRKRRSEITVIATRLSGPPGTDSFIIVFE